MKNLIVSLAFLCILLTLNSNTLLAQEQNPFTTGDFKVKYAYDTITMDLHFKELSKENFNKVNQVMNKFFNVAKAADESILQINFKVDYMNVKSKIARALGKISITGDRTDVIATVEEEWNSITKSLR